MGYIEEQPNGTFFFIDVNNLKKINDDPKLGHKYGDLYLRTFADVMTQIAKKYGLTVCRAGSDEFAMYYASREPLSQQAINKLIYEFRFAFKVAWEKN